MMATALNFEHISFKGCSINSTEALAEYFMSDSGL